MSGQMPGFNFTLTQNARTALMQKSVQFGPKAVDFARNRFTVRGDAGLADYEASTRGSICEEIIR
jgi:hypothetical protein